MSKLNINMGNSYKLGLNEVLGLEQTIEEILNPVVDLLSDKIYWSDKIELSQLEYKSRDGFIPYKNNCGGIQIVEVIPECESYEFGFLEFGEIDESDLPVNYSELSQDEQEKAWDSARDSLSDHMDAIFRLVFKFEGIDSDGNMSFYLFLEGGNQDAPYFRQGRQSTIFEADISAKTLSELKLNSKKHINKLVKILKGGK